MNKIKRVSLFFRVLFQILFIVLPTIQIIGWINAPESLSFLQQAIIFDVIPKPYQILHTLSATEKFLGFFLSMIPTVIQLLVLYFLIKLFRLYEENEIFSLKNVRYIRNTGYTLLLGQLMNPVYEGVMGLVLTWNNPHGHRFATITFDQTNFGILLTALLVILISWIMAEGCKLHEERQLTI